MEENNSAVFIDIEKLQSSLRNNVDYHCGLSCNSNADRKAPNSICKFRKILRTRVVDNSDYEPVVVSIGPYHHGNEKLQDMEKLKWKSLEYILTANPDKALHDYIEAVWVLFPAARSYYAEDIKMQDSELVHVLLLDACFIVAFLCGFEGSSSDPNLVSDENSDIRIDPLECTMVARDFLLIENQIPFFIVKRIYELFSTKESTSISLSARFAKFFEQIFTDNSKPTKELESHRNINHLLHLCQMYLRPSSNGDFYDHQLDHNSPELTNWHQAVEYHFAGIKFQRKVFDKNSPQSLLDVSFSGDALQIPYLFVTEITAATFRNLIALEQANPRNFGNHINTYIFFISQIIRTTKDVRLLVDVGIIGHHFDSEEEVSCIFTSLGESVMFDFAGNFYLKNIWQSLEAYYKSRMKWGLGWLRRAKSKIQVLV